MHTYCLRGHICAFSTQIKKNNNPGIPKRKAPEERIKKAKYVQQQNVSWSGFSLLYQIPENSSI